MTGAKHVYSSAPEKEHNGGIPNAADTPKGLGARHLQTLLLFVSLTIGFTHRSHLSVSLVAMTNPNLIETNNARNHEVNITMNETYSKTNEDNKTVSAHKNTTSCDKEYAVALSKWNVYRTYRWNKPTQEMILFAFFVGYTSMMIPAGILAQKYGGKKPILMALLVNGIISIFTPWVPIFADWMGVCACRLLQGMTQAAFFPSIHTILGKWAPLSERGRLSTYVYTGSQFGTVLSFQISGLFASNPSLGWPAIFWLCGITSLSCFGLYAWLGSATPYDRSSITPEELLYIIGDGSGDTKKRRTPWMKILTSSAVWGLVSTHAGSAIGYIMILTQTPTYMSKVLGVDIKRNGLYSSLPYIAMYFMSILSGYLSDYCVTKKLMTVRNIRRTANSFGMVVSSLFLVGFGFVTDTSMAVIILMLCLGLHSGVHVGFHINHIDLAPNFAGPIMAVGNTIANLTSLMVPVLVSNLIKDDVTNQHRWQILFIVIAAIQILTNVVFVIFVRGEVQPWNFYGDVGVESDFNKVYLEEKNENNTIEMEKLNAKHA